MEVIVCRVSPFDTNCYIVYDEASKIGAIIDPGGNAAKIMQTVSSLGISPKAILITHGHCDHVGAAKEIQDAYSIPLWIHREDEQMLNDCPEQADMFGLPPCEAPRIDHYFEEGVPVNIEPLSFRVLHTPGHSSGGVVLVSGDVAFCGDTIFDGSIGRTDLPGASYKQIESSIRQKIYSLPEKTVLYTGHGSATTVKEEMHSNPFVRAFGH